MSARQRLTFAAIAVVIAVVAVVVLVAGGGSSDDDQRAAATATTTATADTGGADADAGPTATATAKPKPAVPRIVVRDGQPVGGVRKIEVDEGDRVAFSIRSDTADEVHVHGFDLMKDVAAGGRVSFSFK